MCACICEHVYVSMKHNLPAMLVPEILVLMPPLFAIPILFSILASLNDHYRMIEFDIHVLFLIHRETVNLRVDFLCHLREWLHRWYFETQW